MYTVIRILLAQGDQGQVNYMPGTLQPHDVAPGHAQADCVCRVTVNAITAHAQNDYMCRYHMRTCAPDAYCDNRRYAYESDREAYDRGQDTYVDAATGLDVAFPEVYPYNDLLDDDVQQNASAPAERLHEGVVAGPKGAAFRFAPMELRHRPLNPHTDEYEEMRGGWGTGFLPFH